MNTIVTEMPKSLRDMNAIVTGGAKGIGLGIAKELARHGCRVALWDMDLDAMHAATEEIAALGVEVQSFQVNVAAQDQVEAAVAQLQAKWGRIDVLVNNAGIGGEKLVTKMDLDFWKRVIDINLTSQFICSKAVIPGMVERNFGRIINIGSRAWLGNRGQASYSASKGGVVSFTRTMALEFARNGITANVVAPGITETPMFATLKDEVVDGLKKSVPMQRIGQPDDIAQAVRFFAEPASSYITGQLLYVCGGRSLSSSSV